MNSTLHPDIVSSIHSSCDIFSQFLRKNCSLPPTGRSTSSCATSKSMCTSICFKSESGNDLRSFIGSSCVGAIVTHWLVVASVRGKDVLGGMVCGPSPSPFLETGCFGVVRGNASALPAHVLGRRAPSKKQPLLCPSLLVEVLALSLPFLLYLRIDTAFDKATSFSTLPVREAWNSSPNTVSFVLYSSTQTCSMTGQWTPGFLIVWFVIRTLKHSQSGKGCTGSLREHLLQAPSSRCPRQNPPPGDPAKQK